MADVVPGVGEEVLLLELEQFRVDVEVAVHPVGLDQRAHGIGVAAIADSGDGHRMVRSDVQNLQAGGWRASDARGGAQPTLNQKI